MLTSENGPRTPQTAMCFFSISNFKSLIVIVKVFRVSLSVPVWSARQDEFSSRAKGSFQGDDWWCNRLDRNQKLSAANCGIYRHRKSDVLRFSCRPIVDGRMRSGSGGVDGGNEDR